MVYHISYGTSGMHKMTIHAILLHIPSCHAYLSIVVINTTSCCYHGEMVNHNYSK